MWSVCGHITHVGVVNIAGLENASCILRIITAQKVQKEGHRDQMPCLLHGIRLFLLPCAAGKAKHAAAHGPRPVAGGLLLCLWGSRSPGHPSLSLRWGQETLCGHGAPLECWSSQEVRSLSQGCPEGSQQSEP